MATLIRLWSWLGDSLDGGRVRVRGVGVGRREEGGGEGVGGGRFDPMSVLVACYSAMV